MGNLTDNFSTLEFFVKGKFGTVCDHDIAKAKMLCLLVLQPTRDYLNKEKLDNEKEEIITITSGKRSPKHNTEIGGSARSDHLYIRDSVAADFTTAKLVKAFEFIIENYMDVVGQLIIYPTRNFIHVSLSTYRHTGEIMIYYRERYIRYTNPEQLVNFFRS